MSHIFGNSGFFSMNEMNNSLENNLSPQFDFNNGESNSNPFFPLNEGFNGQEPPQNLNESNCDIYNPFENNDQEYVSFHLPQPNMDLWQLLEKDNEDKKKVEKTKQSNLSNKNTVTNSKNKIYTKNGNNKKISKGRKKRADNSKRTHTKDKKDNKMRKVKAYFLKFIYDTVNASLSKGHRKFLKIDKQVNEDITVEYNLELMNKTIKAIYEENSINERYKTHKRDYNAELVKKIYSEKKETKAMKILDLTFIQYLELMRKNHLQKFKDDIRKKEIKNGESEEDEDKYMEDLVDLLFNYKDWFSSKTPRTKKSKNDVQN